MSNNDFLSRRELLRSSALWFGNLAFLSLLAEQSMASGGSVLGNGFQGGGKGKESLNPLAPKAPQFPARAKRVIFVFLHVIIFIIIHLHKLVGSTHCFCTVCVRVCVGVCVCVCVCVCVFVCRCVCACV